MTAPSTPEASAARPLGLAGALALALTVGFLGGMLFGLHEAAMTLARTEFAEDASSLSRILGLTGYAVFWNGVLGAVLSALVGACAWAAARSRRKPLSDALLLGVLTAAMTLAFARTAIWEVIQEVPKAVITPAARSVASGEVWAMSALSAICIGYGVYRRCQRLGRPTRPLAFAFALFCGLAVWACWTVWVNVEGPRHAAAVSGKWTTRSILAIALMLGAGVYHLLVGLLARPLPRARRRCVLGAVAAAAAIASLTFGSLYLNPRSKRGGASPESLSVTAKNTPNILWIVMDSARADALSCYGNARRTTPHLDQLAAEGALFERAFVNAPWTLPSHASMFTGKLPHEHRASRDHRWLEAKHTTVAEVLAQCGYRTFARSANPNIGASRNLAQGFQQVSVGAHGRTPRDRMLIGDIWRMMETRDDGAKDTNRLVQRWIAGSAAARRPFFVFINYMEAHHPYGSTPYAARWLPDRKTLDKARRVPSYAEGYVTGAYTGNPEDFQLLRALYDGDMTYLDERIGELVGFLRQTHILDDTLLIVTSDHGEELGEHGLAGHSYGIYNTLLHIPLIIRYPKLFPPGSRHKQIVQAIDLFPTILDALDAQWQGREKLAGQSLLAKPGTPRPPYAIAQRELPITRSGTLEKSPHNKCDELLRRLWCVVTDDLKYVLASDGHEELYDLRTDFHEQNNIVSKHRGEARSLRALLGAAVDARPGDPKESE